MLIDFAKQLEGSPLFKGVSLEDREVLIRLMHRQSYPPGAVLFERGSPGDSMYLILTGRVRIYTHDAEGREFTIRYLDKMFGEFSMLDGKPRSASADAAGALEVLMLHRDDFLTFLEERPLVGLAMMRDLVERVRYTTAYLQQVLDATQHLAQGQYEQAVEHIATSTTDTEIQEMIDKFMQMARRVQAREETLKRASKPPRSP